MRIQCREDTTAVHTHYDLILIGPNSMRVSLREPQLRSPTEGAEAELVKVFEHPELSLSPSASKVAVRFAKHGLSIMEIAEPCIASPSNADAVAFLTDEILLSVRPETDASDAKGPRGLFRGRHGAAPERITLPAVTPVTWPQTEGGLWKSGAPFAAGQLSAGCVTYSNAYGHLVVDATQGIVLRVNRLGTEVTAHRVPSAGPDSEVALTACATDVGFITVHHRGRGPGVINHFAADGRHLGALAVAGNIGDVCVTDGAALFLRESADNPIKVELVVATLPALTVLEVAVTRVNSADGYPGLDARDGGRDIWVGNGAKVRRLMRSTRGWEEQPFKLDGIPLVEPSVMSPQEAAAKMNAPKAAAGAPSTSRTVVHPKFGTGRVLAEEGRGDQTKLKIEFADGVRTLLARFVRDA